MDTHIVVKVNDSSYELDNGEIIQCGAKPLVEVDDAVYIINPKGQKYGIKTLVCLRPDDETTKRVITTHQRYAIPEPLKKQVWERINAYVQKTFNSEEVVKKLSNPENHKLITVANFINSVVWKNFRQKSGLKPLISAIGEDLLGISVGHEKESKAPFILPYFAKEWLNRRILRQFYLWGLNKKEAVECSDSLLGGKSTTVEDFLEKIFQYPERFGFLKDEKISNLEMLFGYTQDYQRTVRKNFLKQMWNAVNSGHSFRYINKTEYDSLRNGLEAGVLDQTRDPKATDAIQEAFGIKFLEPPYFSQTQKTVRVMPMSVYKMETYVVNSLAKKISRCPAQDSWIEGDFDVIDSSLSGDQLAAVRMILKCPISVVTGGPGTGKTRIIREVIQQLNSRQVSYHATSFTGKAVARIKETCQPMQIDANTIDKLVILGPDKVAFKFLIIDEASMVTTSHLYKLFNTFHPLGYSMVFVGDLDQLPPIGWGHIFDSLIWSQRVPLKRLTHNYRVDAILGKEIVANSQKIVDYTRNLTLSHQLEFDLGSSAFTIMNGGMNTLKRVLVDLKDKDFNVNDITILTPYNATIEEVNPMFQKIFSQKLGLDSGAMMTSKTGRKWYVGDRVVMRENCYITPETGVMNGQIGKIIQIVDSRDLIVEFPNYSYDPTKEVEAEKGKQFIELVYYTKAPRQDIDTFEGLKPDAVEIDKHLDLAYAMTIHKSQGSEYVLSLIYLPDRDANKHFLTINMLYTAVTRAKKFAWIIHDGRASLIYGLSKRVPKTRNTVELQLKESFALKKYVDGIDFESLDMTTYTGDQGGEDFDDDDMLFGD